MAENMPGSSKRAKQFVAIVELFLGVSLIMVTGLLVLQNRELKLQASILKKLLYRQSSPDILKEGDYIMEVRYRALEGESITRSFLSLPERGGGRSLTMALIRPDCGYCEAEVPIWNALAKRTQSDSEFVAIAIGSVAEIRAFMSRTRPEFSVFQGSGSLLKQLRAPGVPYLVKIASDGRVEEVVAGAHAASESAKAN